MSEEAERRLREIGEAQARQRPDGASLFRMELAIDASVAAARGRLAGRFGDAGARVFEVAAWT